MLSGLEIRKLCGRIDDRRSDCIILGGMGSHRLAGLLEPEKPLLQSRLCILMRFSDTIELVLEGKGDGRVLFVTPDQSVYEAIGKMTEAGEMRK